MKTFTGRSFTPGNAWIVADIFGCETTTRTKRVNPVDPVPICAIHGHGLGWFAFVPDVPFPLAGPVTNVTMSGALVVMNFTKVISEVVAAMERAEIRYALIGGFAMALRGVQRATMDLDFILALDDLDKAEAILTKHGYQRVFRSENVSHYQSAAQEWGRIDILHAFRRPSLNMLERAESIAIEPGLSLRVVHTEDIIGLKIQALLNDPERAANDWHDIYLLIQTAGEQGVTVDWALILEYLRIFKLEGKLSELQQHYGHSRP